MFQLLMLLCNFEQLKLASKFLNNFKLVYSFKLLRQTFFKLFERVFEFFSCFFLFFRSFLIEVLSNFSMLL